MLGLLGSAWAIPRPLREERALHAGTPDARGSTGPSTLSSSNLDAPTHAYDPFMHVKGTPSILFGVMTGKEMHESRARSVLVTWCATLDACIFFSDEHNPNKQPATCAPASPSPQPLYPARLPAILLTLACCHRPHRQARHEHVDDDAEAPADVRWRDRRLSPCAASVHACAVGHAAARPSTQTL